MLDQSSICQVAAGKLDNNESGVSKSSPKKIIKKSLLQSGDSLDTPDFLIEAGSRSGDHKDSFSVLPQQNKKSQSFSLQSSSPQKKASGAKNKE